MAYQSRNICKAIIGIACLASSVNAQSGIAPTDIERVGQSGWQFLKINGDARQAALAGAYTAISFGDANAIFGNPATLSDVTNYNVQINSSQWIADIGHQSIAIAASAGELGVFGASVARLNYGDMAETVNLPIDGGGTTPYITGNTFSANDIAIGLSYARKITNNLSFGGNVRWMREKIAELSMTNWSLDFGTLYYTGLKSLRIAIVARNFGPDSKFGGWSEEYQTESVNIRLPLDFRVGLAMDFLDDALSPHLLTMVVEGEHPNDGKEKYNLGASYSFEKTVYLRCGYKFNYDVQTFTCGAGLAYSYGGSTGTVNYAYADFGELTHVHTISLGFTF